MSPTLKTSEGGRIGENGDERAGSAASGRTGAGSCQRVDARGSGREDGAELPANQAAVEALPETRGGGTGARERGAEIEPGQAAEVAGQGAAADPVAVLRRTKREIRADAGGGASGQRKGNRDWGRHPAAVDAGRRAVEPGKESAGASQPASPPRTFRRTGADGRQLPPVVGRTRARRLFDEPGG